MSEEKSIVRPAAAPAKPAGNKPSLWDQALRAVKGDSTNELIEQFTQEMTLVAEGLCEDQARLRRAVDGLIRQAETEHGRTRQDHDDLAHLIDAQGRETEKRLGELSRRLDALERAASAKSAKKSLLSGDTLGRVTLLASIVCGTLLIVTVLKLFM